MKTITIIDPADLGKWLDQEQPCRGNHSPFYGAEGWHCVHWIAAGEWITANSPTADGLLQNIREKLAEIDPIARLKRQAEAAGFALTPLSAG